jgi:membrane-associated protein
MDVLRPLFDWLADHTYLVVFLGTVIDATGLPFPGRLLLAAAGALAANGHARLWVVIALGALGATLVDQVWYLTITRGSNWLLHRFRRRRQRGQGREAADYFRRYGAATIILGRFFTVIRVMAWPLAATHGIGYGRFVLLDLVGATLWAAMWVLLGWVVGDQWESVAQSVSGWAAIAGAAVALAIAAPVALHFWRRRARASL